METLDANNPKHARADDKLRHEIAAWLTTVTADGQPQSTPIWFHWDGSTFLIYSQPDRPKLRNIAGNPKVSLHLVGDPDGEDVDHGGRHRGRSIPPRRRWMRLTPYVEKYRSAIEGFGWTPSSMAADYAVAIRVRPTRFRVVS